MARIYLSSTSDDLKVCRKQVMSALRRMRHEVISMEDYTAMDGSPLDECLQDVETCEAYVGLFAWRYGYIPDVDNPERKSITELEYLQAKKTCIPCYIFILDEDAHWPTKHVDDDRSNVRALREEFCRLKMVDFFTDENTLATKVSTTIAKWERSLIRASITLEEHERRLKQREAELRAELSKAKNQTLLESLTLELQATQEQITNLDQSYQAALERNQELQHSLETLQAQHPGSHPGDQATDRLQDALDSVKAGDNSKSQATV